VTVNTDGPVLGRHGGVYELAERSRAISHGGIGVVAGVVKAVGLAGEIDSSLHLLASHRPYFESDHVLNIVYNALCGGTRLDDIESRRNDAVFLDALGVDSLPDPTTAGDFCRRFDASSGSDLQDAISRARLRAWGSQPASFLAETARIDADASNVGTSGETKRAWTFPTTASGDTRLSSSAWPTRRSLCSSTCTGPTGPRMKVWSPSTTRP
jgi:hypothetical protein